MTEEKKEEEGIISIPPEDQVAKDIEKEKKEKEGESEGDKPEEETPEKPESKEEEGSEKPEEEEEAGDDDKKKDKKKEEGKPEEEEEEEEEEETEEEGKKTKRTPKLMATYKHKIAEKKWIKKEQDLKDEVADLKVKLEDKKGGPEREKKIKEFADKHSFDEDMVKDLLELIPKGESQLPPDFMKQFKEMQESKEEIHQQKEFDKDFEKSVVPLATKDGVSADKLPRIQKIIQTYAFTEKYANNDLDEIYLILKNKGKFEEVSKEGKKSIENSGSRSPHGKAEPTEGKGFMDMSDKEFDDWLDEEVKKEDKTEVSRDGQTISV